MYSAFWCPAVLARRARLLVPVLSVAAGLAAAVTPAAPAAAASGDWPSTISARYKITFNGFDIGNFDFAARFAGSQYTLRGDASISALLGAVRWRGVTQARGRLSGGDVTPANYGFEFDSNARSGSVRLDFHQGDVSAITADPPLPSTPDEVPLERRHLADVLDPLSAVAFLTNTGGASPCGRKLPVFDGKQRFDLTLVDRGTRPLPRRAKGGGDGLGDVLHVCQIRYAPLGGYRRDGQTEAMARNPDIEIAFRAVGGTHLFVPHAVTIPTGVGTATLALERMDVRAANAGQIAFVD